MARLEELIETAKEKRTPSGVIGMVNSVRVEKNPDGSMTFYDYVTGEKLGEKAAVNRVKEVAKYGKK